MTSPNEHEPITVHVKSSDVPFTPPKARGLLTDLPRTIVLTSAEPSRQLLPAEPGRVYAILQVLDNDAVLCRSKGEAQAGANQTSTLAEATGAVIPTGVVVPLRGEAELWITTGTYPTRISVIACYRR